MLQTFYLNMKILIVIVCFLITGITANAQVSWINLDSLYQPLPATMHVYQSTDSIDGKPNIMYYVIADLKDKRLNFTTDTSYKRRIMPSQFFEKENYPVVVVNASFFSFATNSNLNIVERNGKMLGYNIHSVAATGKDTFTYYHSFDGALGISKKRNADIAWVLSDSSKRLAYASESTVPSLHDSTASPSFDQLIKSTSIVSGSYHGGDNYLSPSFKKWKMKTAIGGGPVLVQNSEVKISNDEERKFYGKAINDRHPRTAIGYTADNKLIILVAEGRSESASGLTLIQEAHILKDLGCKEALNLDGGGSTCMLVNGKQTNSPSDKEGQRAVPSVFLIERNGKMLGYNIHSVAATGKDTFTYYHSFDGALGISKKRNADIAWVLSDSSKRLAYASESTVPSLHDSTASPSFDQLIKSTSIVSGSYHGGDNYLSPSFKKWKMKTAIGGGPVLVQNSEVKISNDEERKFYGKAINDRHPRTAIGYTADNKLIILVAEGRSESASGLTLIQEAHILKDLGCKEALNLDGGGSTCMLVNGKQTNSPSDKEGQRAVPSVFLIERK